MSATNDRPPWDDGSDVRIGVPIPPPDGKPGASPDTDCLRGPELPPRRRSDPSLELREGETELGRPPQVPTGLTALSDADRIVLQRLEEEQAARELAEAEMLLASDPSGLGWLGWL